MAAAAARLTGLKIDPGAALDLTTVDGRGRPWDFSKEEVQRKALRMFKEEQPALIMTRRCQGMEDKVGFRGAKADLAFRVMNFAAWPTGGRVG